MTLTLEEEDSLRRLMAEFKTVNLRGTLIQGYSKYAMESAIREAYILGKKKQKENEHKSEKKLHD